MEREHWQRTCVASCRILFFVESSNERPITSCGRPCQMLSTHSHTQQLINVAVYHLWSRSMFLWKSLRKLFIEFPTDSHQLYLLLHMSIRSFRRLSQFGWFCCCSLWLLMNGLYTMRQGERTDTQRHFYFENFIQKKNKISFFCFFILLIVWTRATSFAILKINEWKMLELCIFVDYMCDMCDGIPSAAIPPTCDIYDWNGMKPYSIIQFSSFRRATVSSALQSVVSRSTNDTKSRYKNRRQN